MRSSYHASLKRPTQAYGLQIDWNAPTADRLLWMSITSTPHAAMDLVRGFHLPVSGGATLGVTRDGVGLLTDAVGERAQATTPAHLKINEGTIIWRGVPFTPPSAYTPLAVCSYASTNGTAPYVSYGLFRDADPTIILGAFNFGGNFNQVYMPGVSLSVTQHFALTFTSGSQLIYSNGGNSGASSFGTATGVPLYDASSQIGVGRHSDSAVNPNCVTDAVWIYGKALTAQEIWQHFWNPYSMLRAIRTGARAPYPANANASQMIPNRRSYAQAVNRASYY